MEILVDGLFLSVESFMETKIPSFKELQQPCLVGLNLCREAIALNKAEDSTCQASQIRSQSDIETNAVQPFERAHYLD